MTSTTHHTTGAELQTLREACGLDRAALGELCGVEARTVKHWETRPGAGVPADVVATVSSLATIVRTTAARLLEQLRESARQNQAVPAFFVGEKTPRMIGGRNMPPIVLIRYQRIGNMPTEAARTFLHVDAHGAMVTRLAMDLAAEGFAPRVVWFDSSSYTNWREALRWTTSGQPASPPADTAKTRAAWAESFALAEQSKQHRGDQPPPPPPPAAR